MTGIREVHERATATAGVRETVPTGALPAFFARALAQTAAALDAQGIHPIGPPYGRYYSMPGADVDVEVGFPVSAPVKRTGRVSPGELPGGRVVEALHAGSFDTLSQTYAEVRRYFEEHDLTPGATMWEQYLTDPSSGADPSTWRTRVCWPVV